MQITVLIDQATIDRAAVFLLSLLAGLTILAVISLLCAVVEELSLGEDRPERDERKGGPWGTGR